MPKGRPTVMPSIATGNEVATVTEIVESMTGSVPSWERTPRGEACERELRAALDAYDEAVDAEWAPLEAAPAQRPGAMPWEDTRPAVGATALASGYVRPAVSPQRIEAANAYLDAVRAWAGRLREMCQRAEEAEEAPNARKQVMALWDAWEGAGRTTAGQVDTLQALVRNAFGATAGSLRARRMLADCLTGMGCEARAARALCGLARDVTGDAWNGARGLLSVVSAQVNLIPSNGQNVRDVCADMADLVDDVAAWAPAKPGKGK